MLKPAVVAVVSEVTHSLQNQDEMERCPTEVQPMAPPKRSERLS
jgi:hypothetical protein